MKFEFQEIITNTVELNKDDLKDYLKWCDNYKKNPKSKYSLINWINEAIYISDWVIDEDTDYNISTSELEKWIKQND